MVSEIRSHQLATTHPKIKPEFNFPKDNTMTSEARQIANSANALLSTGPRTDEGKARSSQNARKHGLTSAEIVLAFEDREEFEELQSQLQDDIRLLCKKRCSTKSWPPPGSCAESAAWSTPSPTPPLTIWTSSKTPSSPSGWTAWLATTPASSARSNASSASSKLYKPKPHSPKRCPPDSCKPSRRSLRAFKFQNEPKRWRWPTARLPPMTPIQPPKPNLAPSITPSA